MIEQLSVMTQVEIGEETGKSKRYIHMYMDTLWLWVSKIVPVQILWPITRLHASFGAYKTYSYQLQKNKIYPSPWISCIPDIYTSMCICILGVSEVKSLSCVWLLVTPWTIAYQAPPSMEFSRQEYWSGLPFPSPEDLPNPGIEPGSPALQADALPSEPPGKHVYREATIKRRTFCIVNPCQER